MHRKLSRFIQKWKAIFCCEEERFKGAKNWLGYPEHVISYIFANLEIELNEIDMVVLTNERIMSEHSKDSFKKYYDDNFELAMNHLKVPITDQIKSKVSLKNLLGLINNLRQEISKKAICLSTKD